jgi:hypothetical protein
VLKIERQTDLYMSTLRQFVEAAYLSTQLPCRRPTSLENWAGAASVTWTDFGDSAGRPILARSGR